MNAIELSRRSVLRGLSLGAGATVLSPLLQRVAALGAVGEGALPRRIVFIVEANGLFPNHVQPVGLDRPKNGAEKLLDRPIGDHGLPEAIKPLEAFKDRLTIIQGLSGRSSEGGTGGHSTNYGALGCYSGGKGPMAQTIDAALAAAMPGVMPHIGLGIHNRPEITVHYSLSAVAPGKPLPIQCRPELAYKSLFGSVADGAGRREFDLRTGLLDYMAGDVKKARGQLSGDEREKLDRYIESYESLHDRQVKVEGIKDALRKQAPRPDKFVSPVETDRLEGQFDLAAAALIGGLTNVVTLTSGGGGQHYITFNGLGIPVDGHSIGHGAGFNGKTWDELRVIIRQFHAKQIARFAAKLQSVPEGNGTVLDNTLIVYLSDSGESHHPRLQEWPIILLGNLGGRLKTGKGRVLEYPKYGTKGHRTIANLYLSLLQASGAPRDRFGVSDTGLREIDTSGPLSELLT